LSKTCSTIEESIHLFQAHPWHGIPTWNEPETLLNVYVEVVPSDTVKYELGVRTGHLHIDRPQRFSNVCPTLYGFLPRTLSGVSVASRAAERTGRAGLVGDGDPLDVCVLTEATVRRGAFLAHARPVGGIRTIDGGAADDKIIAVLDADSAFGDITDVTSVPIGLMDRLRHYFLTYKQPPDSETPCVTIAETFGRTEALEVVRRASMDYRAAFPGTP
jgi:inorganic pyrophosphatase